MRVYWLLFFVLSHIAHTLALEVILNPYDHLTEEITVYDLNRIEQEPYIDNCDCNCFDYSPITH